VILLDTSGLLCYHHQDEPQHADAENYFESSLLKLTHSYVLAEFVPLCQTRGLPRAAALAFAHDLLNNPLIECVWVDEQLHRSALALLRARSDKTYSLCDAVSFLLMRQYGVAEALTTDRHFEQEGFERLLRP
jgi:predicted nucleic acid-binding protein